MKRLPANDNLGHHRKATAFRSTNEMKRLGNTPPAGQDQENAAEADTPQASDSSVESDDKIAEPAEETDAGENVPEESPGATGGENGDN